MKKQIKSDGFASLVESITERMVDHVRQMNAAAISGNSLAENDHRNRLSALDLVLFSINLHASIVDESEPV